MTNCPETWWDETGHNDTIHEHHCAEPRGFHDDHRGFLIHKCTCGAESWEEVTA